MLLLDIGVVLSGEVKIYQSRVQMVHLNTSSVLWDIQVSGFPRETMLMRTQKMIAEDLVQVLVLFPAVVRNRGNL
jgi:hypothetical protein